MDTWMKWCSFVLRLPQARQSGKSSLRFHLQDHSSTVIIFRPWPTDGLISTGSPRIRTNLGDNCQSALNAFSLLFETNGKHFLPATWPTIHDFLPLSWVHKSTRVFVNFRFNACPEVGAVLDGFFLRPLRRCHRIARHLLSSFSSGTSDGRALRLRFSPLLFLLLFTWNGLLVRYVFLFSPPLWFFETLAPEKRRKSESGNFHPHFRFYR